MSSQVLASRLLLVACRVLSTPDIASFRKIMLKEMMELTSASKAILLGMNETVDKVLEIGSSDAGGAPIACPDFESCNLFELFFDGADDGAHSRFMEALGECLGPKPVVIDIVGEDLRHRYWIACDGARIGDTQSQVWRAFSRLIAIHSARLQQQEVNKYAYLDLDKSASFHRQKAQQLGDLLPKIMAHSIVGSSTKISRIREQIAKYATSDRNCLVTGETGTGKELVARNLHTYSDRNNGPFIAENMASISPEFLENTLFGHTKGAFTGAAGKRDGLFKQADGGTLFLDEIGDLSLELQAKLLRVIEEKSFRPLGSDTPVNVDVRIVSATHQDLKTKISQGLFRQDLFYRLAQLHITVPPLRERKEDIGEMARHFLKLHQMDEHGVSTLQLPADLMEQLEAYNYPGNIRELQNIVLQYAIHVELNGTSDDFECGVLAEPTTPPATLSEDGISHLKHKVGNYGLKEAQTRFTREILKSVQQDCEGDRNKMAEILKLPKRTLSDQLKKYNIRELQQ